MNDTNIGHAPSPETESYPINWPVAAVLGLTFLAAITIVPWYGFTHGFSGWAWFFFALFLILNGIGIGSGYHRLWSHRAYQAHPALRIFLAIFGGMALQNSVLIWCTRHRPHHRYVDDNDNDPYSIGRGFWFAHVGWMVRDYPSGKIDYSVVPDLKRDPVLMWQHRHYVSLALITNIGLPMLMGWMVGDFWGVFLLAGVARLVVNHHVTFFINSLAHIWGKQPYTDENSAKDNWFIAMLTYGEGYHNFHHMFQTDYRNGHRWWHFDMNKWFISACSGLGLARGLNRTPQFKILHAKLNMEFKVARQKLEAAEVSPGWREQLEHEYAEFRETVKQWQHLQMEKMQLSRQKLAERIENHALTTRYRELERSLRMQHKRVALLASQVSI
ncbi:MAG TPA: fatty acid desaturase [Xanthomonadales bacterium]|nr:fatty acid desaturase [Xanthomonadales bacterium]